MRKCMPIKDSSEKASIKMQLVQKLKSTGLTNSQDFAKCILVQMNDDPFNF